MRTACLLILALCGCRPASAPDVEANPLQAPPVDLARVGTAEQVSAWNYRRTTSADLDGDAVPERLVLVADVEVSDNGAPLWEDGHRWALYVEPSRGERTLLYGAFVPNGSVEAAVLGPAAGGQRTVLVQERTPQEVRALEVEYLGPGRARSVSSAYYQVERWVADVVPSR